jgi:hypothetical protein
MKMISSFEDLSSLSKILSWLRLIEIFPSDFVSLSQSIFAPNFKALFSKFVVIFIGFELNTGCSC